MTRAKDEHLPYPADAQQPPLSKMDCTSTPEEHESSTKFQYIRVVGQLMYSMVHTMVAILYALNVLYRYDYSSDPRHILFLKYLLRYIKHSNNHRIMFRSRPCPRKHAAYHVATLKLRCRHRRQIWQSPQLLGLPCKRPHLLVLCRPTQRIHLHS